MKPTSLLLFIAACNMLFAQQPCDTLANVSSSDTPSVYLAGIGGYMCGHNAFGDIAKADAFTSNQGVAVTEAFYLFGVAKFGNTNSSITAAVWDNTGVGGSPGNMVASETLLISDIALDIANVSITHVQFTNPPVVSGNFYVGITFTYATGDTVALTATQRPISFSTGWEQRSDSSWITYNDSWGTDVAHFILPVVCPVNCSAQSCDDFSVCTSDTCINGACMYTPVIICDDNDACTYDECYSLNGTCTFTAIDCDDGDPCTTDGCNANTGCEQILITCDDSDACTDDWCDGTGTCGHFPVDCNDLSACTVDACDSIAGCVYTVNCDDGSPCTTDACVSGQCEFTHQVPVPEICIVGIDDATGKNLIVWEKPVTAVLDSYLVYRETSQANVYAIIGAQAYSAFSTFVDQQSVPEQSANKYKLGFKDVCGQTTEGTAHHKTIHLSVNQGVGNSWNLIWNHYEGFVFATYFIYRGTSASTLALLDSVASNNTSYTDLNPPAGSVIYYQIEIVNPAFCTPTARTDGFSASRSNIVNTPFVGLQQLNGSLETVIYPNPAGKSVTIEIPVAQSPFTLSLFDKTGKKILQAHNITQPLYILERGNLPEGLYHVELRSAINRYSGKIMFVE